jgi:predicted amidohydrolase YtcJ
MAHRPADLLLTRGKIITVDDRFALAEAVAIEGDRIVAVGRAADLAPLAGAGTRTIDLAGAAVIPGLNDGHAHLDREGLKTVYPSLGRVRSIADIQARIAALARERPAGEWIVTMPIGDAPAYFDVPGILAEKRWPTRYELDEAAPDHPVFIRPIWGFWRHTTPLVSIANSRALALAGVTRDTPAPTPSVTIERDARGEPTGVFLEETMMPIVELTLMRRVPGFTRADRARTLPAACRAYNAYGTTSIYEEHGVATELLRAYQDTLAAGRLSVRATLVHSPDWAAVGDVPFEPLLRSWAGWLGEPALGNDFLKMSGFFTDFTAQADNAARTLAAPYTGWAGFNYDTARPKARAKELLLACARNDIRAVGIWPESIDLFYEVHQEIPLAGRRWVFGHISTMSARDIDRAAEMELVMTSHTNRHVYKEGHLHKQRLGPEREREIAPLATLARRGVRVNLATDNVPVSLWYPIWQSVARRSRYTQDVIAPDEALTREQALRAATINGAWITLDEKRKGSIEIGKLADLVVLNADPLTVPDDALKDLYAETTIVGGKVVYERPAGADPAAALRGL